MKSIRINVLEVENLKKIKAVMLDCSGKPLTIIGGRNAQGKTSVLDAIAYALGGEKYRPTTPKREGSVVDPTIRVKLSNGLTVERKGTNGTLKVTDPEGRKGGQTLLNSFIHQFALDLPRFMSSPDKDKAEILLQIIGIGPQLQAADREIDRLYDERHTVGRIADQKKKFAEEMPAFADAPDHLITASELIRSQQDILAHNGENQRKRENLKTLELSQEAAAREVNRLREMLATAEDKLKSISHDLLIARKSAEQLQDESTAEIEANLSEIEQLNTRARANMDKAKAIEDAAEARKQWAALDTQLEDARKRKSALLDGAELPLPGLGVEDGRLTYKGQSWDCMSTAEQLVVSTAIVRKLNPQCGFVLLDRLETMDTDMLAEFAGWLDSVGLQAIATRVSTGDECSIIIEDGIGGVDTFDEQPAAKPTFKLGEF